ncbi:hypothetical protein FHS95_000334 [Sphingomonas naasensis]|uniref:Uncharacterized protein n=1 Tax=Sphingomonas naasensis TaxID=1344951 RepID=A0A4S1WT74_9SPHN|nr:hypothetical protein [Sphingomonas naasensis]NIJ18665.1 hypothetical protein [Sphingomonas naasensis]TGX45905.1 hypothetical protein E5A74_01655 [Sphingomonas naasensis]
MRELTDAELDLISGGYEWDEDIVVTGVPYPPYFPPYWPGYTPTYPSYPGGGGGGPVTPPPADALSHDVVIGNLDYPLTAEQLADIQEFRDSVARANTWVNNLADNAQLVLENGDVITGAEVKAAWANTDFVINKAGTVYNPGTPQASTNSESRYNDGNPVVSINMNLLHDYAGSDGGTDYLVLHEIAHLTSDQRADYTNKLQDGYTAAEATSHERMASDIARAIVLYNQGTVMADPTNPDRYSTTVRTFQAP